MRFILHRAYLSAKDPVSQDEQSMHIYASAHERVIHAAFERIYENLDRAGDLLAREVRGWLEAMSGEIPPEEVFKHPRSYPMLLYPWWVEQSLCRAPNPSLQTDLAYSTVNGYYAIRMVDNLMDGHTTVEQQILPALNFFHTEFQRPYQRTFAPEHPFWDDFRRTWYASAEVTIQDARAESIDRDHFVQITARKTCAVKIPIAAVCYRYQRPERIAPWAQLVDLFGCWHQMDNDLYDWRKDTRLGTPTYLLSEGRRRVAPSESVTDWVIREGFAWGMEALAGWMAEMRALADRLDSPELRAYLDARDALLAERYEKIAPGLQGAARLLALLRQAESGDPGGQG
jgi:hypothetical protein